MLKLKISVLLFICLCLLSLAGSFPARAGQLKFAVISDIRNDAIDAALEFISSQNVDCIIVAGDYYYLSQDYYPHFVEYDFEVYERYDRTKQKVYFAIGKHDNPPKSGFFFRNSIAAHYPDNGPADSPKGTIFSFDRGNCHFVFANPYCEYPEGGYTQKQLDWLERDLANSQKRFKFVVGHEPAFPRARRGRLA